MEKKKILIAYNYMMVGGSTTSLLSILSTIDYKKYIVDLICLDNTSALFDLIPHNVRNVYVALDRVNCSRIRKILNPRTLFYALYSRGQAYIKRNAYSYGAVKAQIMNKETARISLRLEEEYDIAIAFIETWATEYVANYVKAKRKIAWYHLDYIGAGFCAKYDRITYRKYNNIVLVSDKCKENFDKVFPELSNRTVCIENILTKAYIEQRAGEEEQIDIIPLENTIQLVTTCRIDFQHKGLDRAVKMFAEAKKEVTEPDQKIKWHIFGDGADLSELKNLIRNNNLQNDIITYGAKNNPLPWVQAADLFFLPSRYEGKPMAVTEALLLGVPAMVTNYASASGQVENGKDGIIIENSEEGIKNGLIALFKDQVNINEMTRTVRSKDYSNLGELEKIYELFN